MDDLRQKILNDLLEQQQVTLTDDQDEALRLFMRYLKSQETRSIFLLKGSAGTGKTFLIHLFRQILKKYGQQVVLLAPTGQAAKVITKRTQRIAFTIHHHIYTPLESGSGDVHFMLKPNKETRPVAYLVDEASMIGDQPEGGGRGLLSDLLEFVFDENPDRKLILVGDPVQLPPVGHADSPALQEDVLRKKGVAITTATLTTVLRQETDSGILENAVRIRDAFTAFGDELPVMETFRDVSVPDTPWEAVETFLGFYSPGDTQRVVFLTYSNFQATRVNQAIRAQLHGVEEPLIAGDVVVVMRNNYTWGDKKKLPFIANGELGVIREVYYETLEERYKLNWVSVLVEFTDAQGIAYPVEAKVNLDLLTSKATQLEGDAMRQVWYARRDELRDRFPTKVQFEEALRTDPYIHALQIKYGYAMTCHKAQGGQWENAIVLFEPDYGQDMKAYLRWTYTVVTRASERLFLLSCPFIPG